MATDRRRHRRRTPGRDEPLSRVRLRTGRTLLVIDVSDSGALVEGARLLPGTHLDVHIVNATGRVLVRSRIVRAYVSGLTSEGTVYRGALAFERLVDTLAIGYAIPVAAISVPDSAGTPYPAGTGFVVPAD